MTTTAPGPQTVKPRGVTRSRVGRRELLDDIIPPRAELLDDDPTEYPDSEVMCREPVETEICLQLQSVLRRYQADRGVVCYIGSDAFIYWVKGNIKACVSPDIYVLPGIAQTTYPAQFMGSHREQCWKTWIHHVVPNFALEVKAQRNPRKDELQSPPRHDALGTKELIVFDPFIETRRPHRRRFVVYRRNGAGKLVIVLQTNDDRVYSQELEAFVVAQGGSDHALLRLGLGPNGERLLPFESELVDMEARRADHEARMREEARQRADQEARMREEEARRADEAKLRADEATRRAEEAERRAAEETRIREEEARRKDELERQFDEKCQQAEEALRRANEAERQQAKELRRAEEAIRQTKELQAELARLRAETGKRRKK